MIVIYHAMLPCLAKAVASFLNQFYSPSDLTKFQTKFKLTPLSIENTIGPNQANKPGVEASLDVQYLTGMTPPTTTMRAMLLGVLTNAALGLVGVTNDTIRTWVCGRHLAKQWNLSLSLSRLADLESFASID